MKKFVGKMVIMVGVLSLLSISAFAKNSRKDVTFANDVTVNGTVVKAGTYTVVFDDAAGRLSIMKGNKTVATSAATLEKLQKEGGDTVAYTTNSGALVTIGMDKGNQAVLTNTAGTTGNSGL
jgi:hypothetical protein